MDKQQLKQSAKTQRESLFIIREWIAHEVFRNCCTEKQGPTYPPPSSREQDKYLVGRNVVLGTVRWCAK
ncbi:hypothetical protein OS493_002219 [Desmophyllum pertusum]|uniref:Uncharacterized protein n=1 Tax=Desmophyllum pertusum TaxID=174260 RepID=A0A9X0CV60_9CNID|nr:hypothetical protein OS493_002219 [Desmophyllum pertusum]